ncbi:MAG: autotransporter domain-containing protein [Comamonas sp.]
MNQIYRVVFNTLTGAWQAVSEIARGRSKSSRSAPTAQRAAPGRNPQRPALHATAVLAAVLSICGMAQATPPSVQYWDGGQTTANGTIDGGSGSWAAGTTNWTDANGNSNSAWAGGEAVFQGTAGTVQMNGPQTATGLRFATDGYVLDGGVLNLASTATVQTDAGVTATLNVTLGSFGTVEKRGTGTLVLNGGNAATTTKLFEGTLVLGNNQALGAMGQLIVAGTNTTLDANTAVLLSNTIDLGSNTLTLGGSHDIKLSGTIMGSGALVKNGAADLMLSGSNNSTGGITLNEGTLIASSSFALGSGALTVGGNVNLDISSTATLFNAINLRSGTLTFKGSNDTTLYGVISGSGALVKNGSTNLTLTGVNTYTGSTTVNSGTLAIGAGGSLSAVTALTVGSGATFDISASGSDLTVGSLAGAGTLALDSYTLNAGGNNQSTTFSGSIGGAGGLNKTGSGTLTLTGNNNYGGGTTVSGGTLVASVASLGSGAITNNATLELNQASNATLTKAISGTGQLSKTGAGTLTLKGANTYSGGTTIHNGTLAIGSGGSLAATGAVNLAGAGTFDMAAAGNQTIGALSGVAGSTVALGAYTLTMGAATNAIFSGSITGTYGSLVKNGGGVQTLNGASTYSGGTTISGGTLVAANANALGTGNVTVGTGAALEVASGTALTVGGDLTFQPGSTYRVYSNPNGSASSVHVSGTATLAGSVLHVGPKSDFAVATPYTILTADGGIAAGTQFDAVQSSYAFLTATLGYTANDVTLTLQGVEDFGRRVNTANQQTTVRNIQKLGSSSPLYQRLVQTEDSQATAVANSLSGDAHATVGGSLVGLGAFAPSVSQSHLRNNLTAGMTPGAAVAQSDGSLPASAWPSSKALPAWAEVVGHWQRYDGDGNAATLKQRTTGLFLGMDQEVGTSGWRLGGSLGYTNADGKVADRASESDVNSYSAAVYGGKSFGTGVGPRINVLGGLAYTWHDIATTRRIESLGQTLKADYSAHTAQLFAEVGYAIGQYDKVGFEPFVGVSLGQQRTGSFQERGGFAALQGRSNTDDLASTTLGLRVHSDFQVAGKDARLRATVGWRHAFGDVATSKTMAFEGGQNFTVAGSPLARNTAVLGLEGEVALSRTAALVLGYRGELGSGQRDHAANVKLRWAF